MSFYGNNSMLSSSARRRPQGWTPAALRPALELWLDADDASTITLNGSTVSQWRDKSGKNRDVSQPSPTKQPVYANNILNGLSALSFDGSDDSLFTNAATITLNQPVHRFIVCKFLTKTFNSVVFDSNTQSNPFFFYNGEKSPGGKWWWNAGSYGTSDVTSNHIHYNLYNNTASYYSTDGATPSGPVTAGTNTLQGVRIGGLRAEFFSGYAFQGYVYEVLLVQGTLSDADRQKLEGYLAWKWGLQDSLATGHPYKLNAP